MKSEKINFSVPTGNFGDIFAGFFAKKMGLPINKLLIATNTNNILQRVLESDKDRKKIFEKNNSGLAGILAVSKRIKD